MDSLIDTVSAVVVWLGMKLKRETLGVVVVIVMMFGAGASIGYESVIAIIRSVTEGMTPMAWPLLVVAVEGVAILFAGVLFVYQRFTGKRSGSFSLISQSVDSKNHIFVGRMVIGGAVFAIFGVSFLDAFVGGVVAARILIDAAGLAKDMFSSMKGEELALAKYELPLEKQWRQGKLEAFRTWILYAIQEEAATTRETIITVLERTFTPDYVPILSEFHLSLGKDYDFRESFPSLIEPLLANHLLRQDGEAFILTPEGRERVAKTIKARRFHMV